jgi:hypothetical protein
MAEDVDVGAMTTGDAQPECDIESSGGSECSESMPAMEHESGNRLAIL